MRYIKYYFFLIILIPFSCKKTTKDYSNDAILLSDIDTINKSESINEANNHILSNEYKELRSKQVNYSINDSILQEFASKLSKTKHKDSKGKELTLEQYEKKIFYFNKFDSIINNRVRGMNYDLPNEIYLKIGDSFRVSTPKIYELFKKTNEINFHKIKDDSLDVYQSILMENKKFTMYSLMFNTTVDCRSCKYDYRYAAKFLVSIDNANSKILDVFRVSFISGNHLGGNIGFSLLEDDKIYYVSMKFDERSSEMLWRQGYKISDSGRIINYYRYYEKNGSYVSDREKGFVEDSTRSKKWIFKKDIGLFNSFDTYTEGNYVKGIRQGEFKYYILTDKDEKGKLICTETYQDGVLQKRNFVE